ncbi:hypothetical protein NLI96_g6457 [Meripilus lineatus]|uniref:DUF6533 domain-containing protein n=1 Tax=Meripilus lineatus TaxID=2056292 RepID=A0AAD5V182_9APHY|nr:hypothetical protein NLI96_g6457 [Physisporinus lineatus]
MYSAETPPPKETITMNQTELPWDISSYYLGQSLDYSSLPLPVLLIYEVFSTFDDEVNVIWKRKFSLPSLLYFSIRIGALAYFVINESTAFYSPEDITHNPEAASAGLVQLEPSYVWAFFHPYRYRLLLPEIVLHLFIMALTWVKTYGIKQDARKAGFEASLVTLLIRDGTLYFGGHLLINIIGIIINYTIPGDGELSPLSSYSYTFSSILFTRFILNLRLVDNDSKSIDTTLHYSSINFATSFAGNMGAPLESNSEDTEDRLVFTVSQHQMENPLSIGLPTSRETVVGLVEA